MAGRKHALAAHLQAQLASHAETLIIEISQADAVILVSYTDHDGERLDDAQNLRCVGPVLNNSDTLAGQLTI